MADVYKVLHPVKYFDDFVSRQVRPDGRKFLELRPIKLNLNCASTADASAMIRIGNTSVICGIKLELATPRAEEPNIGFIVTNVEVPPLCSSKYRPGPPSDQAQVTSNIVSDIIINSNCIDLKNLCIVPDKLAWVLHCDMICLDNDGSIVDACIITLLACLKSLTLPHVEYNTETEEITVDTDKRNPLEIHGIPVATSFSIYNSEVLLADPCADEEDICGNCGANLIICCNNGLICSVQKFGCSNLSNDLEKKAFKVSRERTALIEDVINTSLKNITK